MAFKSVNAAVGGGGPGGQRTEADVTGQSPQDILSSLMSGGDASPKQQLQDDSADGKMGDVEIEDGTESDAPIDEISAEPSVEGELEATPGNIPELEITSDKKAFKFKLDPADKKLKQALEWGMAAPRFVRERKEAQREVERLKGELTQHADRAKIMAEIEDLRSTNPALAIKTILGDEAYKKFYNDSVFKRVRYELARADDPDEAAKIANEFLQEEREQERFLSNREIKKRDEELNNYRSKDTAVAQRNIAEGEFFRLNLSSIEPDSAKQEALGDKIWKLAMSDVEEYMRDYEKEHKTLPTITAAQYRAAFQENFKALTAIKKSAATANAKTADARQTSEKNKAGEVAKKALPKANAQEEKDFNSLSVFDKLRAFGGK